MAMAAQHLFVYGSLRRSLCPKPLQATLRQDCELLGMAWAAGRLYEVDGYPGLVGADRSGAKVYGELYRLLAPNRVLLVLDDYEQCSARFPRPHEYVRKRQPVFCLPEDDTPVIAWLYLFNHSVAGLRLVSSGDYCRQ